MLQVRENAISLRRWSGDIAHLRTFERTLEGAKGGESSPR